MLTAAPPPPAAPFAMALISRFLLAHFASVGRLFRLDCKPAGGAIRLCPKKCRRVSEFPRTEEIPPTLCKYYEDRRFSISISNGHRQYLKPLTNRRGHPPGTSLGKSA